MSQGTTIEQQPEQQKSGDQQGRPTGARSQLVQRLLDHSVNLPAFIHDLLSTQAVTVAGTEAAAFLLERNQEGVGFRPIAHIRPDNSSPDVRAQAIQAFQDIVKPCVQQGKDGAIEVSGGNDAHEAQYCLVTLLRSEGEVVAVSAVITRCRDLERARQRLQSMLLVAGYFELYTLRRAADQARLAAQSHQHVLQLSTSVATAQGFQSAANNLCNELATRSQATRVSLGWIKGNRIRVKALSHTEQFDKKQELIVQLEKAMEECHDQEQIVQYDPAGKSSENITRDQQALSRQQGGGAVLSLPLRRRDEIVGVATLEFPPNHQLGPQVAHALSIVTELLAPQLWDRYNNDRWLITKAGISTRETAKLVIGPKHMLAKTIIFLVIVAMLVIFNIPHYVYPKTWPGSAYLDMRPTYRVSAPFEFVPTETRGVCAPFEGEFERLAEIDGKPVKPGTKVKAGDILGYMRTDDLLLKRNEAAKQREKALATARKHRNDPENPSEADAAIAEHEAEIYDTEYKLYDSQIQDAAIKAKIDGVVLAGDLEHKQGSNVKYGDVLFEIGELDKLQAEIRVNERDVQQIKPGSVGELATLSLPTEKHKFSVKRIVPLGDVKDGTNTFRVYATLDSLDPDWLPRMAGEARIEVEKRSWGWIWTHRLVDWVRLQLWM